MKKIIAFTIGAVAVLGVSGCSKTETTNETTVVNETSVNETVAVDNGVEELGNTGNTSGNGSNDL
jgi:uncharacterized lipoprotein